MLAVYEAYLSAAEAAEARYPRRRARRAQRVAPDSARSHSTARMRDAAGGCPCVPMRGAQRRRDRRREMTTPHSFAALPARHAGAALICDAPPRTVRLRNPPPALRAFAPPSALFNICMRSRACAAPLGPPPSICPSHFFLHPFFRFRPFPSSAHSRYFSPCPVLLIFLFLPRRPSPAAARRKADLQAPAPYKTARCCSGICS